MNNTLKEQAPLLITIVVTTVILVAGISLLSLTSTDSLSKEAKQEILIRDHSQLFGNKESQIELVEFSDFQCPACAYYFDEIQKVKSKYKDDIKLVFRHFPLSNIHPFAIPAAEAAEAAGAQGKFWEYHELLFQNQKTWSGMTRDKFNEELIKYAQEVEVEDMVKFEEDINNRTYKSKVEKDLLDAETLNLRGTPTFFLNGDRVANPTFDNLSKEIDKLISK